MGLFSSKKRTVVGLTTVPLIEEQKIFNESILGAIFSGNDIADSIRAELRNGFIAKSNRFYRKSKTLFNDTGKAVFSSIRSTPILESYISNIVGFPIEIHDSSIGVQDPNFIAYNYLINNKTFYPKSRITMGIVIGELVVFQNAELLGDELIMTFMRPNNSTVTKTISGFTRLIEPSIQILYSPESDILQPFLFTQLLNEITDETFLAAINQKSYNDYYHSVVIKKDKVDTFNSGTQYERDAKKLLRVLGIDLEYVTEQVNTNEEGASNDMDSCFITFGLPIQHKYEGVIEYLFEYFYRVALDDTTSLSQFNKWLDREILIRPSSFISYSERGFNTEIRWNYSTIETKIGTLSKKYERETIIRPPVGNVDDFSGYDQSELILRKQINNESYIEVKIHGLLHLSDIINNIYVIRDLEDSLKEPTETDEGDSGFYIPLSKTIVDRLKLKAKKQVLYASLILPIYMVKVEKIKWYQRGAFKSLLKIAAIVITIYTMDFSGTALQIATAIASQIITIIIINQLLVFAVEILGIENAFIAAVVATLVAVYGGGYNANGLPWAQELLKLSLLSFNSIGSVIQDEFVKLQNEISNFLQDAREIQEDIDNAAALLDNSKYSFLDVASGRMYFNPYETPDQFYNRSAYDQNPGVKSFDMLYNYVDRMLKLPEHSYV